MKYQLLLEQFRQAAEDYRAEDRNTWQTFSIILALNGVLISFMKIDNWSAFSLMVIIAAVIGLCSTYFGILIISRTALYQTQRVLVLEEIQNLSPIKLYFSDSIIEYMKQNFPQQKILWNQRYGGRAAMKNILYIISTMWILLFALQLKNLWGDKVEKMQLLKKITIQDNLWSDDRGWGINLLNVSGINPKSIGDLHIVSMKPGKVRGNHYHEKATEWILFFGGNAKLTWRELGGKTINEIEVSGLVPTMYRIPPNIEHAVINKSKNDIYLVSINDMEDRGTVKSINLIEKLEK